MINAAFWEDWEDEQETTADLLLELAKSPGLAALKGANQEPMFRSTHDVVLLGFGFKYGMSGETLHKEHNGNSWYVDISIPLPVWYRNGRCVGGMTYDDVVNTFREVSK